MRHQASRYSELQGRHGSPSIAYQDFCIRFEPRVHGVYPVSVIRSPAGVARGSFRIPFQERELADHLLAVADQVRAAASPLAHPGSAGIRPSKSAELQNHPITKRVGGALFQALFSGSVGELFSRSLGTIENSPEQGLRILLHFDPAHPDLAKLTMLPWEFLYWEQRREYVNLNRASPVIRYLEVPRPEKPLLQRPLRILLASSSPRGYPPLELQQERRQIEQTWARHKDIQVTFLETATAEGLRKSLLERPFHVLHFMGHGGFDDRTGEGAVVLEDGVGAAWPVTGEVLSNLLRSDQLRLVVLNACETAKTGHDGQDPFTGVAAALVMAGLPAVVAMQHPISDRAANTFSHIFYHRLAVGESVDTATVEGRVAMHLSRPESFEWGTPVLFVRTSRARIVEPGPPLPGPFDPQQQTGRLGPAWADGLHPPLARLKPWRIYQFLTTLLGVLTTLFSVSGLFPNLNDFMQAYSMVSDSGRPEVGYRFVPIDSKGESRTGGKEFLLFLDVEEYMRIDVKEDHVIGQFNFDRQEDHFVPDADPDSRKLERKSRESSGSLASLARTEMLEVDRPRLLRLAVKPEKLNASVEVHSKDDSVTFPKLNLSWQSRSGERNWEATEPDSSSKRWRSNEESRLLIVPRWKAERFRLVTVANTLAFLATVLLCCVVAFEVYQYLQRRSEKAL